MAETGQLDRSPPATRTQVQAALRHVALGVSAKTGVDVFEAIARYLTLSLNADFAFVSRVLDDGFHLATLAVCYRGRIEPNVTYTLAGTPCEHVFGKAFYFLGDAAQRHYPGEETLIEYDLDSYAGYPLFAGDGRPLGLIAVAHGGPLHDRQLTEDVLQIFSVRAAAELERLAAEASYRAIFETCEDAIFVHDIDTGAVVDVNPKACSAYGYSHADMLRIGINAISGGPEPYNAEGAAHWLGQARTAPQRFEWRRRNQDGSLHWDEVVLKRAAIGGVDRVLAFTREITQRKQAEAALRASERQYRAVFNAALDCIISMDGEGRVLEFNPAAEACFGYRREQVIGQPLAALIVPPRLRADYERGLAHYRENGRGPLLGRRTEVVALRADGSEFPAELAVEVVRGGDDQGDLFVGYLRDLTEAKRSEAERGRLERQLRQAQRMEAIGHLTGGIAHDFNNLLTGMLGYTTLAAERAGRIGDEKSRGYLTQVQRAAEKARDLIQQMLTFSRGGRGEPKPVALEGVIAEFIGLVKSTLPATIEIETRLDPALPPALVDPLQLEQVLMNLCINARDAMAGVGRLRVELAQREVERAICASCQRSFSGRLLALTVADTGPGFAIDVGARMFEPFFTTKGAGKGSGMGLAMVHGIVHECGGHLLVESERGRGAVFRVLLPPLAGSAIAPATRVSDPAAEVRAPLRATIAVVDDEPMVAEFMAELLGSWGARVCRFCDPEQALAVFAADPDAWDLAILDQSMPKLTGLELARRLLQRRPGLPVFLYTGFSDEITPAQVRADGVRTLLKKPLDQDALYHQLRAHLAVD